MKGYKGFNADMTCRGMQYEIGKTYRMDKKPRLCTRGFHFCDTLSACFDFYDPKDSVFCEIEASGDIEGDDKKRVTNVISVIKMLAPKDVWRVYYGYGHGYGYSYRYGCGNGYGFGNGHGYGDGYGNCNSRSYSYGCGNGYGYGYSGGDGYGNGNGYGCGYGDGRGYGYYRDDYNQDIHKIMIFKED